MLCIIAPAKRIKTDEVFMSSRHQPFFLEDSRKLLPTLKALNQEQLRRLLKCSPQIAEEARKQAEAAAAAKKAEEAAAEAAAAPAEEAAETVAPEAPAAE